MVLLDVVQFLSSTPPFNELTPRALEELSQNIQVAYVTEGEQVPARPELLIIRTGLFVRSQGPHQQHLQTGDFSGYALLLNKNAPQEQLVCEQDGLVYFINQPSFDELCRHYKNVEVFFQHLLDQSLHLLKNDSPTSYTLKVADLLCKDKVALKPTATIADAAKCMTEQRVSCVLVEEQGVLVGILTDRDLRSRVLAENLAACTEIQQVMTRKPYTIATKCYVFEALKCMSQFNIHHLPVEENGHIVGVLTTTDLVRCQQEHPVYLISHILRQTEEKNLIAAQSPIQSLLKNLAKQQLPALEVSAIYTTVMDALTQSWIKLAEQTLGAAPCVYSWLSFGSQARADMLPSADQDNALLLEKEPTGSIADYFKALSDFVCSGLANSGHALCQGLIMANQPTLRLSLKSWSNRFASFVHTPTPEALLRSSIFFDVRVVHGSRSLFNVLQQDFLAKTQQNDLFLYHLAKNATDNSPPLGFFKHFLVEDDGLHKKGLDLKKRGISLITDLARVYALHHNVTEVSTKERLIALEKLKVLSPHQRQNLQGAYEVLANLRWKVQAQELTQGRKLTNVLELDTLHLLERHQLRDAFTVINQEQKNLRLRYCHDYA